VKLIHVWVQVLVNHHFRQTHALFFTSIIQNRYVGPRSLFMKNIYK